MTNATAHYFRHRFISTVFTSVIVTNFLALQRIIDHIAFMYNNKRVEYRAI
jgi:hypothetical protein